jgi:serine/threonine-protein kinase RIO1
VTHPKAGEFLRRDCSVVRAFFERNGLASALLVPVDEMVRIATTKQALGEDGGVEHAEFVALALQGQL